MFKTLCWGNFPSQVRAAGLRISLKKNQKQWRRHWRYLGIIEFIIWLRVFRTRRIARCGSKHVRPSFMGREPRLDEANGTSCWVNTRYNLRPISFVYFVQRTYQS